MPEIGTTPIALEPTPTPRAQFGGGYPQLPGAVDPFGPGNAPDQQDRPKPEGADPHAHLMDKTQSPSVKMDETQRTEEDIDLPKLSPKARAKAEEEKNKGKEKKGGKKKLTGSRIKVIVTHKVEEMQKGDKPEQVVNTVGHGCTLLCCCALPFFIVAVANMHDCPIEPNIPVFLLGVSLISLVTWFIRRMCEPGVAGSLVERTDELGQKQTNPCTWLIGILELLLIIWLVIGSVWVYRVYPDVQFTNTIVVLNPIHPGVSDSPLALSVGNGSNNSNPSVPTTVPRAQHHKDNKHYCTQFMYWVAFVLVTTFWVIWICCAVCCLALFCTPLGALLMLGLIGSAAKDSDAEKGRSDVNKVELTKTESATKVTDPDTGEPKVLLTKTESLTKYDIKRKPDSVTKTTTTTTHLDISVSDADKQHCTNKH